MLGSIMQMQKQQQHNYQAFKHFLDADVLLRCMPSSDTYY
jgi:hypothetical protein